MIDLKEHSLREILTLLRQRSITCVEAAEYYLDRILRLDGQVHSVSQLNPDALEIAAGLDRDFDQKKDLPLYGLPFLLKENIATGDKMKTTAGTLSLADAVCAQDAPVAAALRAAGAVLLGKASCTELANYMADNMPDGYSALYPQVLNPYNPAVSPLGSSSGSGVAVAMNFCVFAIGTDTGGSVLAPSCYNGLCGMRPAGGTIDTSGIVPISHTLDTWGPMCRFADDAALVFSAASGQTVPSETPSVESLTLLVETHASPYLEAEWKERFDALADKLRSLGAKLVEYHFNDYEKIMSVMHHEMKHDMALYLEHANDGSGMRTLRDIIDFNARRLPEAAKYGQALLERADNISGNLDEPEYLEIMAARKRDRAALVEKMDALGADGIITPHIDSVGPYMAFAGVTMPYAKLSDGINAGFLMLAPDNARALRLAAALEPHVRLRFAPEDEVKIDPDNLYPANIGL